MPVWGALILVLSAMLSSASASAYELNPLKDRTRGGEAPPPWMRKFDTVHEDITHAAVACAGEFAGAHPPLEGRLCRQAVVQRRATDAGNIAFPLIVGVWWNDDPSQFGHANLLMPFVAQYLEMRDAAQKIRRSGWGKRRQAKRNLLFRSHYGDLQFLHGMASADAEHPLVTQQKIIDWMSFTFGVAAGRIPPHAKLSELDTSVGKLFRDPGRQTVGALFKPRGSMTRLPVAELALGSMLHLVQDSFSASHAQRVAAPTKACPHGRIAEFRWHLRQASGDHTPHDSRRALLADRSISGDIGQDPVDASARIILLTRARADWATVVEPYLRRTLFCVDLAAVPRGDTQ